MKSIFFLSLLTTITFFTGCAHTISLSEIAKKHSMRTLWNPKTQKAFLTKGEHHVAIKPGSKEITIGEQKKTMETKAYIKDGEVRISESFYKNILQPLLLEEAETVTIKPVKKEKITPKKIKKFNLKQYKVVIDAGHGGRDPGAIGIDGSHEKTFTLKIAKRIAHFLRQQGIRVVMTRYKDVFIPLKKRVQIANISGADCFVSIHLNSAVPQAKGFELWISRKRKEKRYPKSMKLARWIHKYIKENVPLRTRGIKTSRFQVVYKTKIPAVLVETCFMSNKEDIKWIAKPQNQYLFARQVYLGILAYCISLPKKE